ncbi:arginine--tRNA ligase-like, partial [Phymastichus coffea]|uniref:arginine--tRNA ligase-like n=1 Tax=Phymastichus coffea TaxID=108790 RepID=UPI00273AE40B
MITPNYLAKILVETITGGEVNYPKIININKRDLATKGDLSFQLKLDFWRGYIDIKSEGFKHAKNILEYYKYLKHEYSTHQHDSTNIEQILEVFENDINKQLNCTTGKEHNHVVMKISNDFVLVNYNRSNAAYLVIKTAIKKGSEYGMKNEPKNIMLSVDYDSDSEMTNQRLKLQKQVSENLLKCQSCELQKRKNITNYIFTVKSEGYTEENHIKYFCGAVLNSKKKKERDLKFSTYLERKIEKIKYFNAQRISDVYINKDNFEKAILRIANASINYELLSTKHDSPVIINQSNNVDRFIKEASFVLYNNSRINSILDKYSKLVKDNQFFQIKPIEKINSFEKTMDDDSWSLVYNYLMKYSDILESLVITKPKLKVKIHLLWSFISNLCHDFSRYYQRNRILLRGTEFNNQMIDIMTE